jgi:hypothetical protein
MTTIESPSKKFNAKIIVAIIVIPLVIVAAHAYYFIAIRGGGSVSSSATFDSIVTSTLTYSISCSLGGAKMCLGRSFSDLTIKWNRESCTRGRR